MEPKHRIIPIFVPHVGCPNDCVFCNQRKISGALTPATPESVRRDILSSLGVVPEGESIELAFYGGSFTAIQPEEQAELLGAVSPFLRSGRISGIRVSTRPDSIDYETVMRIKSMGVTRIELGAQSMDDEVLMLSGRGHTGQDTEKAAEIIKSCGLSLIIQMMTGLPGDTPDKSIYTAKKIAGLAPDGVRIYPTVIIRDTKLYDMWKKGKYREHTVEEAVSLCAQLVAIFEEKGIPVIRLGLNPTDDLSGGEAVAGAYHPAFGELVYSRIYLNKAEKLVCGITGKNITFGVAKGRTSFFTGQKRHNIKTLSEKYGFNKIKVKEADIKDGEIIILEVAN